MVDISNDQNIVHTQSFTEGGYDFFTEAPNQKSPASETLLNKSGSLPASSSGVLSEEAFQKILSNYQQGIANKFLNPYTFSIFGLYYAWKGSLGKIERMLLGAGALAALFFIVRNQEKKGQLTASALYDEYVKQVTPQGLMNISDKV